MVMVDEAQVGALNQVLKANGYALTRVRQEAPTRTMWKPIPKSDDDGHPLFQDSHGTNFVQRAHPESGKLVYLSTDPVKVRESKSRTGMAQNEYMKGGIPWLEAKKKGEVDGFDMLVTEPAGPVKRLFFYAAIPNIDTDPMQMARLINEGWLPVAPDARTSTDGAIMRIQQQAASMASAIADMDREVAKLAGPAEQATPSDTTPAAGAPQPKATAEAVVFDVPAPGDSEKPAALTANEPLGLKCDRAGCNERVTSLAAAASHMSKVHGVGRKGRR